MQKPITAESLPSFFQQLLSEAVQSRGLELHDATLYYLVQLLGNFAHQTQACLAEAETLAGLSLQAAQLPQKREQIALYRRVGDVALLTSGFFSDSLNRKLVDIDYYINMGGNAYAHVSHLVTAAQINAIYEELSQKFITLVGLLSQISTERAITNDQDLLRLYERWLKTGDPQLYQKLTSHGIVPDTKEEKH